MTFWERQNYVDIKNIIDCQGLGNASLMAQWVKNLPANAGDAGDLGLIPALGRSPGGGNGNPFQYSCLGNPVDRGAWQATVHSVTKNQA